jgi:hypothetical protein
MFNVINLDDVDNCDFDLDFLDVKQIGNNVTFSMLASSW